MSETAFKHTHPLSTFIPALHSHLTAFYSPDSIYPAMFCCFPGWSELSSNMKGLIVNTVLFTCITVAQLVFGLMVNSTGTLFGLTMLILSLLAHHIYRMLSLTLTNLRSILAALIADSAAMFVDVACYLSAIVGEVIPSEKPRTKRIYALVVSFISVSILFAVSVFFLKDSIEEIITAEGPATRDTGVIMIIFSSVGLLIDIVCLGYAFWWPKFQKKRESAGANAHTPPANLDQIAASNTSAAIMSTMRRRSTIILHVDHLNDEGIDGEIHNINTIAAYAHTA